MSSDLLNKLDFTTKLSTSLFAGFATYCSVVEVPAMLECGTVAAANHWNNMFKRAAKYQSILQLIGASSAMGAYYLGKDNKYLYSGALVLTIPVYTLLGMMTTNYKLMDPENDKSSRETQNLLEKWAKLHAVRSIIGIIAASILFYKA